MPPNMGRLLGTLVVSLLLSGAARTAPSPAKTKGGTPSTSASKSAAEEKRAPVRRGPAKFDPKAPRLDDLKKAELTDRKREESIAGLKRIIPRFEDGSEQKAELFFQLAELYWEKSTYLNGQEVKRFEEAYATYQAGRQKGEQGGKEPKEDHRESEQYRSETVRLYESILRDYPKYPRKDEVLFSLAYNLYEVGQQAAAVARYQELIRDYPQSPLAPDAYVQLGNHWFDHNNLVKAQENYQKAYDSKLPKISSYALYKLAWCDYNAGALEEGLAKLKRVVDFSESAGKEFTDLRNEALKDLVVFFVQLNQADQAIAYFQEKAPRRQMRLIRALSEGLADAGHHDNAIKGFRFLIRSAPLGGAAPEFQQAVVKSFEGLRQRDQVKAELTQLVRLYSPGSEWWKANQGDAKVLKNAFSVTEEAMRSMVTEYHQEAQKTKSVATYRLARDIYKQYVDAFASSQDPAFVADQAFNLRFYYAEILWALEEWEAAAQQYQAVVDFKIPDRPAAQDSSNESYRKTSAYNAVLAYEKLVKIERGSLGKSDLREDEKVDEKKRKGQVEKKQKIQRTALSEEALQEKPLTRFEGLLVAACDRYNALYPSNQDEIEIRYLAAVTLFDKSHFVDAAKRFGEIILKWPEERRSQEAADLTLSVLEDQKQWGELNKISRAFLANRKLSKPGTEFTKRVAGVVEASQYKWLDEVVYKQEKNPAQAAEGFLAFVAEFPHSESADKALTYAVILWEEVHAYDRAISAGERLLKEYPESAQELKVRHLLAYLYEKTADLPAAAEMSQAFVAAFDQAKERVKPEDGKKKPTAKKVTPGGKGEAKAAKEELRAQVQEAEKWVSDALFNSGVFFEGYGQYERAAAAYNAYLTRFKDHKDVPEIAFNLALVLEKQGKLQEAASAMEALTTQFGKDPRSTPNLQYRAYWQRFLIAEKLHNPHEQERAQDELLRGYGRLSTADRERPDILNAYALARFHAVDGSWKAYTDLRFTRVASLKRDFAAKRKKLQELEGQYLEVLKVGAGEWGVASLTRIGLAYADFAQNILKSPDPPGLNEEQLELYRAELSNLAMPLEEKAQDALEKALAKAYELSLYNAWTLAAQEKLNEYRRGVYGDRRTVSFQSADGFFTAPLQTRAKDLP